MKSTKKEKPAKRKAAHGGKRVGAGRTTIGAQRRPILPLTTVAPATLAGIKAEGRAAGRAIDDAWEAYSAVRECARMRGVDWLLVIAHLREGAPSIRLAK